MVWVFVESSGFLVFFRLDDARVFVAHRHTYSEQIIEFEGDGGDGDGDGIDNGDDDEVLTRSHA